MIFVLSVFATKDDATLVVLFDNKEPLIYSSVTTFQYVPVPTFNMPNDLPDSDHFILAFAPDEPLLTSNLLSKAIDEPALSVKVLVL